MSPPLSPFLSVRPRAEPGPTALPQKYTRGSGSLSLTPVVLPGSAKDRAPQMMKRPASTAIKPNALTVSRKGAKP